MNNECDVIRDLLPLYAENMLSEKSQEFVREHLAKCEDCSQALSQMKEPEFETLHGAEPIKKFGKAFRKHTITVAALSVFVTIAIIVLIWSLVFLEYFPLIPSLLVLLLLIGTAIVIFKRKNVKRKKQMATTSQEGFSMRKKLPLLIIFIGSVLALLISLGLFCNIAVYVDDFATYPYASPQAIYGGDIWLYMAWFRLVLLTVVSFISGIKLFKKQEHQDG